MMFQFSGNKMFSVNGKLKKGFIRPHQSKLSWIHRIIDVCIIFFSLSLSCWVYGVTWKEEYYLASLISVSLMVIFSAQNDLYRSWRVYGFLKEVFQLSIVWTYVAIGLLLIAFMTKTTEDYSRLAISTWLIFAPLLMALSRLIIRNILYSARMKGWNTRSAAIIGANEQGIKFANSLKDARWMGINFIGFFDDREVGRVDVEGIKNIEGSLDDVIERARKGDIDSIYITMPLKAETRTKDVITRLADTTVSLYYVPDFNSLDVLHGSWWTMGDFPVVSIYENPYSGIDGWLKRLEDIILASCVLLFIAIPMLIIAISIKVNSPGPVIFKQRRYGIDGREIEVWKFRSMTVCSESDDANVKQAQRCDVRITQLGAILRRTSMDELPQFLNVLKGDMSIVGPRPHAIAHNELYRTEINRYMMRHKVKPGITGWAQVNGWRGETDTLDKMEKRVEFDLEYIRNWSLFFDIKIFFMTFFKGFTGKNAY